MSVHLIEEMPEEGSLPPKERPTLKKRLMTVAKIGFSVGALVLVFSKIDREQFLHTMRQVHLSWVLVALLLLNLGQMTSGLRQRYYFQRIGVDMGARLSISLYYVGMLFNMVLPGGVGGDGYKAWYAKKHYNLPWADGIRVMVSNRAAGLLWLLLFTYGLGFFSEHLDKWFYALAAALGYAGAPESVHLPKVPILLGATAITLVGYVVACKVLLKESFATQWGGTFYSLLVQLLNMLTALVLLLAVGQTSDLPDYLMLFMIACVVSVLPLSVGGAGLRELTFLYGAKWAGLSTEIGVGISVLYFLVNLAASLLGVISFHRLKATRPDS